MRKLGVLLVASILLFVFGVGTFVYEFSQIDIEGSQKNGSKRAFK